MRPFVDEPVGREGHDQDIAQFSRRLQVFDVADMQQIENAVGENDPTLSGAPARGGLGRTDLRGRVQSGCTALGCNEKL